MRLPISWALLSLGVLGLGTVGASSIGCGGSTKAGGSSDAGAAADTDMNAADTESAQDAPPAMEAAPPPQGYPATHPAMPTVANLGGPVVAAPKFIPVTFTVVPADPFVSQIQDFMSKVGATSYWAGNVAEYGVGPATGETPIEISTMPFTSNPVDDTAIASWVAQAVASNVLPAYDSNTVYVLFMPPGLSVTLQGATSCDAFGGYHSETPLAMAAAPYAVIPRCANDFGDLSGIDVVTGAASHELIEATTDPFPDSNPAYAQVDNKDFGWEIGLGGGEVADMCAQNTDAFFKPSGFEYTVQRTWSNKAGKASQDPCIPSQGGTYFDTFSLNIGEPITVSGLKLAVGQSATIPVDLYSDSDTPAWFVGVQDSAALMGGAPELDLKLNKTSGANGDQLQLTIKVLTAGQFGLETFVLSSGATQQNLWVGTVSSQ